jgi:hypothetical protein
VEALLVGREKPKPADFADYRVSSSIGEFSARLIGLAAILRFSQPSLAWGRPF